MQHQLSLRLTPRLLNFLTPDLLAYIKDSLLLLDHFEEPDHRHVYHDYAFLVFPIAKAYEGFLKLYFQRLGVLNQAHSESRLFRIGRSFNPDLPPHLRDEVWIYDDVSRESGKEIARGLWEIWVEGRNHLFHYFPQHRRTVDYEQARKLIDRFVEAMEIALQSNSGSTQV
jgi:hypothetical protein